MSNEQGNNHRKNDFFEVLTSLEHAASLFDFQKLDIFQNETF